MYKKSKVVKRISVALTKEDLRQLNELCASFNESISGVMKRALMFCYYYYNEEKKYDKSNT